MASYKVPQDVEADDKLIGPFSFRQFIYLVIAVAGIALAWGFSRIFIPLLIIPLPIVIFFGALALPLRKDQPMEIYLAAVVSFYLKPRKRLWQADGVQSLIEIIAPKVAEVQRSKDLSQTEAEQRLSYLADLVDSQGWSVRGVASPEANSAMRSDVFYDAQNAPDILDERGGIARSFDARISEADAKRHQAAMDRMHQVSEMPTAPDSTAPQPVIVPPVADPYANLSQAQTQPPTTDPVPPHLEYNPYPSMHQSVIDPNGRHPQPQSTVNPVAAPKAPTPAASTIITTSEKQVSPDIINLANNADLSVETIEREANRIQAKQQADDEVVISLR